MPATRSQLGISASPVTKSGLARLFGLSPSRISNFVAMGLPVLRDGTIDPSAAADWYSQNIAALRKARLPAATLPSTRLPAETFDELARNAVEGTALLNKRSP